MEVYRVCCIRRKFELVREQIVYWDKVVGGFAR